MKDHYRFEDLLSIMKILRGEGGCPWDREQTHQSIRKDFLEEAYEVVDAIDSEDTEALREELGDVLLQVVFHAEIEEEKNAFNIDDVSDEICKKMILRHPHVFGDAVAETSEQVLENWDIIKKEEKKQKTVTETVLAVPKALPALMRAEKVQKRAKKTGFDYEDAAGALADLESELKELKEAMQGGEKESIDEEFGDLLFSCVNLSRFLSINGEESLTRSTEKFIKRFSAMEEKINEQGVDMKSLSLDEWNVYWKEAKQIVQE